MNKKFYFSVLFVIIFAATVDAQAPKWLTKIQPFQTNISTVKDILGKNYEKNGQEQFFYKLQEGNLIVTFSPEPCFSTSFGEWNIPNGTVVGMVFYPTQRDKKTSFYKLPTRNMEIKYDTSQRVHINKEMGLTYYTLRGKVANITYYPARRYEHLKCQLSAAQDKHK